MDELQQLMGDSYKEGMTLEEVGAFFKGKNFADLSTGNYVDKNKFENKVNELTTQLTEKTNELNSKLTEEEKKNNASIEQEKEIERLKQLLSENTITGNKNTVTSVMTSTRDILGIEATDSSFVDFVNNITTEDTDKSTKIANYVAKVVKDSYEKGKQDALKDSMGEFGKGKGKSSSESDDDIGTIGKRLAEAKNKQNTNKTDFNYFK